MKDWSSVYDLELESDRPLHLIQAVKLVFDPGTVVGYGVENNQFLLFGSDYGFDECLGRGAMRFPSKITAELAANLALGWLNEANYGEAPDRDGSVKKGFIVSTKDTNWRAGSAKMAYHANISITPKWIVYGK